MSSIITTNKEGGKSLMRDLNKDWNNYIKNINTILEEENYVIPKSKITFIIRRKRGCDDSICDIIEEELYKLSKLVDDILKN